MQSFVRSESGAVTVDWVVITATVTGLGLSVVSMLAPAVSNAAQEIADMMEQAGPNDPPEPYVEPNAPED